MNIINKYETNKLSLFRTTNCIENYIEVSSIIDLIEALKFAESQELDYVIHGNGSNIFFKNRNIKTLVIKNCIKTTFQKLDAERIKVSSSYSIIKLLKYCEKNNLDSFYYLASVPATVGGAVAMNAGRGKEYNQTIYDYIENIKYLDKGGNIKVIDGKKAILAYRTTIFTGINNKFIIDVTFKFNENKFLDDPVSSRKSWSKINQDYTNNSCGSVFKESDVRILKRLKGLKVFDAEYSDKTINWINNSSSNVLGINILINIAKFIHALLRKKLLLEIVEVE